MCNGRLKTGKYNRLMAVTVVGVVLLFHFAANLVWFSKNDVPPPWDFALHLTKSLEYSDLITSGRLLEMRDVDDYYPPLSRLPAALTYIIFGRGETVALTANFFWFALLVVAIFFIARRFSGNGAGLAAAVFVAFVPYFYNYSRVYALVVPTAAAVAVAMWALAYADGYRDIWRSLLFGAALGAALLVKWSALFFVLPAAAAALFVKPTGGDRPLPKRVIHFAAALGTSALVASPWYLRHLAHIVQAARHTAVEAMTQGDPPVFSGASFTYYLSASIYDMGFALFLVGLAALVYYVVRRRHGWLTVLAWAVGSYLVFTLLRNKDYRFIAPLFPAFAVAFGVAFSDVKLPSFKAVLRTLGVVYVFVIFFQSSFGIGCLPQELVWKPLRGYRFQIYTFEGPRKEDWCIREILAEIDRRGRSDGGRPNVCVVPNAANFAEPTFKYYATRYKTDSNTFTAKKDFPSFCDYVVTKTGDQGPGETNWNTFRRIEKEEDWFVNAFEVVAKYPLPDGSQATLYEQSVKPNPAFDIESDYWMGIVSAAYPGLFNDPGGVTLKAKPVDAERGFFERVEIDADNIVVSGCLTADLGPLAASDVRVSLEDLVFNPWSPEDELQILRLGTFSISYWVSAEETADALGRVFHGFGNTVANPFGSAVRIDTRCGNVPLSIALTITDDGRFIKREVGSVFICGIPFPRLLTVYANTQIPPVISREDMRFGVDSLELYGND
jgi:hypothetical protein